jgi:hypothetical protein
MNKTRDEPALSSEQVAACEKILEQAKQERPGPDELIDRGEIDGLASQGKRSIVPAAGAGHRLRAPGNMRRLSTRSALLPATVRASRPFNRCDRPMM